MRAPDIIIEYKNLPLKNRSDLRTYFKYSDLIDKDDNIYTTACSLKFRTVLSDIFVDALNELKRTDR